MNLIRIMIFSEFSKCLIFVDEFDVDKSIRAHRLILLRKLGVLFLINVNFNVHMLIAVN
jgi:hypothetical protein